jgi:tetratricopeptide (TPR) repeat protein
MLTVLVSVVVLSFGSFVFADDVEQTKVLERRVLPLPFMNRGKMEDAWLGYAISDSIHFKCNRATKDDTRVVFYDYEAVLRVLKDLLLLRSDLTDEKHIKKVSAHFGATLIITGEFSVNEGKVTIKIFAYGFSPKSGEAERLGEKSVEGKMDSLDDLLSSVAKEVLIFSGYTSPFTLKALPLSDERLYIEYAKVLYYKRDPDTYEKAMEILSKLHEKCKEAPVLYQLGWLSTEKALKTENESEMRIFRDVAKKFFNKAGETDSSFARAFNSLGLIFLAEKNYANAEIQFVKAAKADAKLPDAHYALGNLYLEIRKYEKAVEPLKVAYSLKPGDAGIANSLGCTYFELEKLTEAEDWYKRALELDKNCLEAHQGLGLLYDEKGNKEKAAEHYGKYIELGGDDEDIKARLIQLRLELLKGEGKEKEK